jgi:hypothetical protein
MLNTHKGVNILPFHTALSFTESVSTTATEVKQGASRMANRRGVYLRNQSDVTILWGFTSGTCVCELSIDDDIFIMAGDDLSVYVKASSGSSKQVGCIEIK